MDSQRPELLRGEEVAPLELLVQGEFQRGNRNTGVARRDLPTENGAVAVDIDEGAASLGCGNIEDSYVLVNGRAGKDRPAFAESNGSDLFRGLAVPRRDGVPIRSLPSQAALFGCCRHTRLGPIPGLVVDDSEEAVLRGAEVSAVGVYDRIRGDPGSPRPPTPAVSALCPNLSVERGLG